MSLLDLHAEGIDADIGRQLNRPPAPPPAPDFSTLSFFGAALRGPGSAVLERAGTVADLVTKDPKYGNQARRKANEWAPPETAHTADKVIHGLTRFGAKVAADVATLGPLAGAVAIGVDEGNTTTQNLRVQGVDTATAAKVGAVTGVTAGVGAVLPVAGSTVARTAGLVAIGGPGGFMAQEAASREILQRSGYAEEAARHDPTDPLGLALSTAIPGFVGGVHLARLRRAMGSVKTEPAMRMAAEIKPGEVQPDSFDGSAAAIKELEREITMAKGDPKKVGPLTEELNRQRALMEAKAGKPVDPVQQQARAQDAEIQRAAAVPEVVDAARVRVEQEVLARSLPDHPAAHAEVQRAADMVAAGEHPDVMPMLAEFERLFQADLKSEIRARLFPDSAPDSHQPDAPSTFRSFLREYGIAPELATDITGERGFRANSMLPKTFRKGGLQLDELVQRAVERGFMKEADVASAMDNGGSNRLVELIQAEIRGQRQTSMELADEAISKAMAKRASDDLDRQAQAIGLATDGMSDEQIAIALARIERRRARAYSKAPRDDYGDIPLSGSNVSEADAMRSLGFSEEEIADMLGTIGRAEAAGSPDLPHPESATITEQAAPAPRSETAAKTSEAGPEAAAVKRLLDESPDMLVRLPGEDKPMTVAKALERAKEEAAEEASNADLVKAAVECALSFGD